MKPNRQSKGVRITKSSTGVQGRPRKNLKLGSPLLLWTFFAGWLSTTKEGRRLWKQVPEKRNFYSCLETLAHIGDVREISPDRRDEAETVWLPLLGACYRQAPELTCLALPLLIRRARKLHPLGKHRAAFENPPQGDAKTLEKISPFDASLRKAMRNAEKSFFSAVWPDEVHKWCDPRRS